MNWVSFWNEKAKGKEAAVQVGRVVSGKSMEGEMMQKIAKRIAEQLELMKEDTLLDVCCGNGELTSLLLPYCKEIHGVDFSERLIEKARTEHPNITFHHASAEDFNIEKKFDKVLLYFSFQYFEQTEQALKVINNLIAHTKPGGLILIGDIPDKRKFYSYYNSPVKLLQWFKQKLTCSNDMGRFWLPEELNANGMEQAQESWQPYAHYRFDFVIKI